MQLQHARNCKGIWADGGCFPLGLARFRSVGPQFRRRHPLHGLAPFLPMHSLLVGLAHIHDREGNLAGAQLCQISTRLAPAAWA